MLDHTDFCLAGSSTSFVDFLSLFRYMMSVLKVILVPPSTSSPEWMRCECWKSRTLPIFGLTSSERSMSIEWNVVAPPFSGSLGSEVLSLR